MANGPIDHEPAGDSAPDSLGASSADTSAVLRQRAERRLRGRDDRMGETTPADTARLVHELQVHQIELEIQNEDLRRAQTDLEESRARYFDLYDLAPVGYLTLCEAGLVEEANLAAARLLGSPRAALGGQPLSRFICPEDQDRYYGCRRELSATRAPQRCEVRLNRDPEEPVWALMETSRAPQSSDGRCHLHTILLDITARKHGELALRAAHARLRLVAEIAALTVSEWDPHGDCLWASSDSRASAATAVTATPVPMDDWAQRLHPEDRPRVLAALRGFVEAPAGPNEIQYRIGESDSDYRWVLTRMEALADADGRVDRVLLVHEDVTLRHASEDQAVRMAQHDPLTGLPSRALLDPVAQQMIESARRSGDQLAVIFMDLDGFKAINDLHGHEVGDQVLRAVARRLLGSFRAEDLVARLGGDEFVVVMASIPDAETAARAARKVMATLAPPHEIDGLHLSCAASLGISLFPRDGDTMGQLLQRADRAMYQAKKTSPGRYRFASLLDTVQTEVGLLGNLT